MKERLYLGSGINSEDELRALINATVAADNSSIQIVADCPRRAEYALRRQIEPQGEFLPRLAGKCLHAAIEGLYAGVDEEQCLAEIETLWGKDPGWTAPPDLPFGHINLGFIEVIFKNYVKWHKKHDQFTPIVVGFDDLDLTDVVGAVFKETDDGQIILGESKLAMRYDINGEEFIYSGIPDLPIRQGGAYLLLDHKSTNSYLSEYYFNQFKHSNQLRCYCLMVQQILSKRGVQISGALINGIYMGKKAASSEFGGNRFGRYGPMMYTPGHHSEAILNQFHFRKTLDEHEARGYYPQHTSRLCGSCPYDPLCTSNPAVREHVIARDYTSRSNDFLAI